jgi:hypothetical protein
MDKEVNAPPERRIITVSTPASLRALALWLADRKYNDVFPYLMDRAGNRMVGLNWKYPDGKFDRAGIVVVKNIDLLEDVTGMCDRGRAYEK